ncbi:MAG: PKD domain-containing protein [Patescibacteria group bacterium]
MNNPIKFILTAGGLIVLLIAVWFWSSSPWLMAIRSNRLLTQSAMYLPGDTNDSGEVDVDDMICVLSARGHEFFSDCAFDSADVFPCRPGQESGDGAIDDQDVNTLQQLFAGNQKQCWGAIRPCRNNKLPQAVLNADFTVAKVGQPVNFTATGSRDLDAKIDLGPIDGLVEYRWNFGDGTTLVTGFGEVPPSHTYFLPGVYTASLAVVDRCGAISDPRRSPQHTLRISILPN